MLCYSRGSKWEHPNKGKIYKNHQNYLRGLSRKGIIRWGGHTEGKDVTFVLCTCENEFAVNDIMSNDPAVAEGILAAKWFPIKDAYKSTDDAFGL
jgi:hypothetical protein